MTVREMIEQLSKFKEDLEVVISLNEDCSFTSPVTCMFEDDKDASDTPEVIIL